MLILRINCTYSSSEHIKVSSLAHQRDLVERSRLLIALGGWPLLAAGFSTLMGWESFVNGDPFGLPAGPFFWVPMDSGLLALAVLPLAPLSNLNRKRTVEVVGIKPVL